VLQNSSNKYLIIIAGPTAVGKTSLSIQLAKKLNCDIISADSRQIYKEISIGTAKPDSLEMDGIRHHFIDHLSINEDYNAGAFERDVIDFLNQYFKKHNYIIMCGGTGLYIDAVCNGMDNLSQINIELRSEIEINYNQFGLTWLQEKVKQLDPEYYSIVDQKNPARLKRALEVCLSSGKKYSEQRTSPSKERNFLLIKILLNEDRQILYERINNRVDLMMEKGLLNEAKQLFHLRHLNALNTVGYKELFEYFDGKTSLDFAIDEIKKNSRRYAKRQVTWFTKTNEYKQFGNKNIEDILVYLNTELK
jgi:tRNA dimethylallyltransferase